MANGNKTNKGGRPTDISKRLIARAMALAEGDWTKAAEALGITPGTLHKRLQYDSQLRAMYIDGGGEQAIPDNNIIRPEKALGPDMSEDEIAEEVNNLGESIRRQEHEVQRSRLSDEGLRRAGLENSSIERLKALGDFDGPAGRVLFASMELSNRTMVDGLIRMFELSNKLEERLEDPELDDESRVEYLKVWTQIQSERRKVFVDLSKGAVALAQISGKYKGGGRPPKPVNTYQPLSKAPKRAE